MAIGASAGGLDALEQLLSQIAFPCGRAFVVIQHLDPRRPGALVELLQRVVPVPVKEARQGIALRADRIYVIPPGKNIAVRGRQLQISRPTERRGLRLPIDFFMASLASERGPACAGVVLSGMGSDGTEGLRAIQQAGGRTFAQSPSSAKFDGMPQSAIDAGVVHSIGSPSEIATAILSSNAVLEPARKTPHRRQLKLEESAIQRILDRVLAETGQDFSEYKPTIVLRRIERRVSATRTESLPKYAEFVEKEPGEASLLAQSFLIGVTSFFRDPEVWDYLARDIVPGLLRDRLHHRIVRAWVPGCATGEEAYTLAIVMLEALEQLPLKQRPEIRIFATDLDPASVDHARQGLFEATACQSMSAERVERWFTEEQGRYRVRTRVRELLVFAAHDIVVDPPFTKLDLLSCRNLMIYLAGDLQRQLIDKFHYCLNPDGILLLGASEATPLNDRSFVQVNPQAKIFRRLATARRAHVLKSGHQSRIATPLRRMLATPRKVPDLNASAMQALVDNFSPSAVVTSEDGDILHVLGRVGKYLEPSAGKASLNVYGMVRSSIRRALTEALGVVTRGRAAKATRIGITSKTSRVAPRVIVKRLTSPDAMRGLLMIAFDEKEVASSTGGRGSGTRVHATSLRRVELELEELRQENANTGQQLTAAIEELQAMNEELQSANEELTTSKEETLSMNEELQTVNAELQSKLDTFTVVNNDLRNLFDSTDIATIFLDDRLCIRRFTKQVTQIFRLIPSDVGRALTDVQSDLTYPDMMTDISGVLATLSFSEKEVPASGNRYYLIRAMPYKTSDNVIDGVVITFTDISVAKRLEQSLRSKVAPTRRKR